MSLDRGRHAAMRGEAPVVDMPRHLNERYAHLVALREAMSPVLACGIVVRRGTPMLSACRRTYAFPPRTLVEIGCDFDDGGWRFVWADDGTTIAPVEDLRGAVDVVARRLADLDPR